MSLVPDNLVWFNTLYKAHDFHLYSCFIYVPKRMDNIFCLGKIRSKHCKEYLLSLQAMKVQSSELHLYGNFSRYISVLLELK